MLYFCSDFLSIQTIAFVCLYQISLAFVIFITHLLSILSMNKKNIYIESVYRNLFVCLDSFRGNFMPICFFFALSNVCTTQTHINTLHSTVVRLFSSTNHGFINSKQKFLRSKMPVAPRKTRRRKKDRKMMRNASKNEIALIRIRGRMNCNSSRLLWS